MKSTEGGENGERKMISSLRNMNIRPQCFGEHKIQRGSILKNGMKFSKKNMNGKHQISGRESLLFQEIFYYYSISVEVNLELPEFTIFKKSSLPLHNADEYAF